MELEDMKTSLDSTEDIKVNFDSTNNISTILDGGTIKFGELEIGTTATGEAGSKAIVTNSGTSEHAILNFIIPRGEDGVQGKDGESGVYIGETEPSNANVWIDLNGNTDPIPTKTSQLENDSGFIENIGAFNEWDELNNYDFENNSIFMFNMAGEFSIFAGTYIGHFNGYKSGETYLYKYINCININNIQSLQLDMLNKSIVVRQIPINDSNDYFKSNGLDSILQEIGSQLKGVEDLLGGI